MLCVGLSQNIWSDEHVNSFWHKDCCSSLTSGETRLQMEEHGRSVLPGDKHSDFAKYKDDSRKTLSLIFKLTQRLKDNI